MRKIDLCLSSEGAEVILATSSDEKHPPENMIDGLNFLQSYLKMPTYKSKELSKHQARNPETFWTTTGMFPQEFIICFHKHVRIERLVIQSYFVRTLRIEKSTSKEPVDFEPWIERDLVHTEGQLQNEEVMVRDGQATYLRFIIMSAFDHFASVHNVSAEGMAVSNLSYNHFISLGPEVSLVMAGSRPLSQCEMDIQKEEQSFTVLSQGNLEYNLAYPD